MSETHLAPADESGSQPQHAPDAVLRDALPEDAAAVAHFVHDLARAEDFPGTVTSTAEDVHEVLFGADAFVRALVAEVGGTLVGFALYYPTYSTVTGSRGLHLEDLFIAESHRGRGLGERLMDRLTDEAYRGGGRLEWWVLTTNTAAHRFYRRLGAREVDEIGVWRLDPDMVAPHPGRTS